MLNFENFENKIAEITYKNTDINLVTSLICKFDDYQFSQVFISFNQKEYLISIDIPEQKRKFITVISNDRKSYYLVELDVNNLDYIKGSEPIILKKQNTETTKPVKNPTFSTNKNGTCLSGTENDIVDIKVLIVYTQASLNSAGSQAAMDNIISQAMLRCVNASTNSNLGMNFILSHSFLTTYVESPSGSGTDLSNLQAYLDE